MINREAPEITWPSPVKINLFLHVCSQLENGYHELQTLFQLLDYGDKIITKRTFTGEINLLSPLTGVKNDDNLIVKAAKLLFPYRADDTFGVDLSVNKVVAMGAGLGGGSSNAATTMIALNYLWGCKLSQQKLMELGLSLGADVPVFINGQTAFGEGVGEKLHNVTTPTYYYLVASPRVHISTKDIFCHPDLVRNTPKISFSDYNFDVTHNDCEKLACKLFPEVANLLQWLVQFAPSRMTGTGASVFAQFDALEDAQKVLTQLPDGVSGFVAKGLNQSPVIEVLNTLK